MTQIEAFKVLPLPWDERTNEMSEMQQLKSFRIWAALATVVIYVFLAATGNA